jgi:hypothetical protein
VIRDYYRD